MVKHKGLLLAHSIMKKQFKCFEMNDFMYYCQCKYFISLPKLLL